MAADGFGERMGPGAPPALVVVDLVNGFTDRESPLWCDADAAVAATARLLDAAREAGAPVAFTTVEYDEARARVAQALLAKGASAAVRTVGEGAAGGGGGGAFLAKPPAVRRLVPGPGGPRAAPRTAPRAAGPVLPKLFASAFFGTPLAAMLAAHGADTVVVTG